MPELSTTDLATIAGRGRLRRRWEANEPWANLLIIHGLGEHSGRYERAGGLLAEAGVEVTSFDLVGHGASGGARGYVDSFSDYLDETEQELSMVRQGGTPLVLFGHSLGGLIVLDYLTSGKPSPDYAIVSAPGLGGGKAWQRALAPPLAKLLPKLPTPTAIRGEQLSRDPEVGKAYFADPLVLTKVSARLGAELFAAGDRVRANLDNLSVPTLVFHGGADDIVPPALSAPLGDLPTVERTLYPRCRHESLNEPEGPEIVADMIEWLRERVSKA